MNETPNFPVTVALSLPWAYFLVEESSDGPFLFGNGYFSKPLKIEHCGRSRKECLN